MLKEPLFKHYKLHLRGMKIPTALMASFYFICKKISMDVTTGFPRMSHIVPTRTLTQQCSEARCQRFASGAILYIGLPWRRFVIYMEVWLAAAGHFHVKAIISVKYARHGLQVREMSHIKVAWSAEIIPWKYSYSDLTSLKPFCKRIFM